MPSLYDAHFLTTFDYKQHLTGLYNRSMITIN